MLFAQKWREMLEQTPNLDFYQDMVKGLVVKDGRCLGVITGMGHEILADAVVLTNGTFLNGVVHVGEKNFGGGRMAERAASGITEQLVSLGFESDRLKTGTPPRIDGRSLDYSKMEEQPGDEEIVGFSFQDVQKPKEQRSCWIAYTDTSVHDILKTGFDRSPMFAGRIDGVGPRYCPSIEDKINRFADRDRHQLFIEPEGWNTVEIYVNGFSTSLPEDVQYQALRMVPGFENVRMFRPGYAIEYDFFPPTQLDYSLETKHLRNLFFAGQINGTTGYEEAACQGLMAGINAHRKSIEEDPIILKRSDAYIGVLIDDLISKGTKEPYRMFTSRAEYRTLLRQDNADLRLTEMSYRIGLAKQDRMDRVEKKVSSVNDIKDFLNSTSVEPDEVNDWLVSLGSAPIVEKQKASRIVLRPDVELCDFIQAIPKLNSLSSQHDRESIEQAGIQIKYQVYLDKERELVARMSQMEELEIPERFDYTRIASLGNEAREKLEKIRPRTLGQASRISGINPSDVQILMVYMGR
jgi:tRNA uridine 5-carboxymethylaminomethyl modification enzyme